MQELTRAVLRFQSLELASERSAIRLVVRTRWPRGLRCPGCGRACGRSGIRLVCPLRCRRFTIFAGTPLGDLRRPRVRALLLALRAFVLTPRGLSARELAREIHAPRMTVWRHLHRLRALLPRAPTRATARAAAVEVCHCSKRQSAGFAVVGARNCIRAATRAPRTAGGWPRLIAETVRTWLNGTHHGVTTRWLPLYLAEAEARMAYQPADLLHHVFERIAPPDRL